MYQLNIKSGDTIIVNKRIVAEKVQRAKVVENNRRLSSRASELITEIYHLCKNLETGKLDKTHFVAFLAKA